MAPQTPPTAEHLTYLRERMVARFDLEELRLLAFDLSVNYDELRGETLSGKTQALLQHLHHQTRIPDLLTRLTQLRPGEAWDNLLPAEPGAISPYKGLLYFDEADAPLFFGREQVTAELLAHLRNHRFLAVVGASGSGKSSVVRAGVIPAIRRGEIAGEQGSSAAWPVHLITPGDEPLKALAATLTRDSESVTATKTLLADLQMDSDNLDLFLYRQMGGGNGRCLLIVDQFEELFTQCRDGVAREMFIGNLITAVTSGQQARLSLILTLRADFYAQAVQLEALRPLLQTHQIIVGAMTPNELRQAIEGPAAKGNWALQPGLVATMLQDVGREPGALPLLSHALQETWARREGRTLTLAGYQAAGGVHRAIAQTADAVYASLTPKQQGMARNIFLRLTELGEGTEDTRRRVALAELLPEGEGETAVLDLLDLLARKRLVTLGKETAQPHAEVSHEALIREWPALRGWLDENREGLRLHRQLTEAAGAWGAHGEDESYLYRGGRLIQAQEWVAQSRMQLNTLERVFLDSCQQQEINELTRIAAIAAERTRASRFLNSALFVANVFAIAFLLILWQSRANLETAVDNANLAATREAEAIAQSKIAQSQALASASLAVQGTDPVRGLLLSAAAGQVNDTAQAYDALHGAIPRAALPRNTWQHEDPVDGFVWSNGGSLILTWSQDGTARVWKATSGEERLRFSHDSGVNGAAWNGDESLILTWSEDGTARVWDATSGVERLRLSHDRSVIGAAWNGDESLILTWGGDDVQVRDAANGKVWLHLSHEESVNGAAWNKDESLILTWSYDNTARVWDVVSGAEQVRLSHDSGVNGAAWNGDESRILTWSGGDMRIWDAASGEERLRLNHEWWLNGAVWSEDGNSILTWGCYGTVACRQGIVQVWDIAVGKGIERLRLNQERNINGATWNESESFILTWSGDGTSQIWDATSGVEQLRLSHNSSVIGAVWNGNESLVLTWSKDNTVRIWDVIDGVGQLRLRFNNRIRDAAWDGDENLILTRNDDNAARVWNATNSTEVLRLTHDNFVNGTTWNEDESLILTWSGDGTSRIWNAASGAEQVRLNHSSSVDGATWNRDGSVILTWSFDGAARIWDAASGVERLRLSHDDWVKGAVWNEDESLILTWSNDNTARVWNAVSGAEQMRFRHDRWVNGAAWNEDESFILTWSGNNVRTWDTVSGEERLRLSHGGDVDGAAWKEDESLIVTLSGSNVRVWDTVGGEERLRLSHEGVVGGAVWNEDESLILTWSDDGTARVWDADSGDECLRLNHDGLVNGAAWNGGESLILTWSGDGTVRIWDATTGGILFTLTGDGTPVELAQWSQDERQIRLVTQGGFVGSFATQMADLLDAACQRATRNLTWTEWQLYFPGQPYRLICPQWPVHDSVPEGERPAP